MDITEAVITAIKMLMGALITIFAKWIVEMVKDTMTAMNVAAKARIVFSKRNRKVFFDIMLVLFYFGLLVKLATDTGSASRLETLLMIGCVLFILFTLIGVLWELSKQSHERERAKLKQEK